MAQRGNHIRTEQKPSFNGKDHLKVSLLPIGTDPSLAIIDLRLLEVEVDNMTSI